MKERPKWERRLYLNSKLGRGEKLTEEEQEWAGEDRDWWGRYT